MKYIRRLLKFFLFLIFLGIIGILGLYLYAKYLPSLEISSANSFYLYDTSEELYFKGSEGKEWIGLNEMSEHIINATINIEDKNFYKHYGFDVLRIIKALYSNIISNSYKQGASTITQQYAKNLYLDFDKTWERKINELWYTIQIETHYNKDTILEGYLNSINYGHGMYGIENASKFYFNKSAKDLNLAEASLLISIPKSPTNYSPINNYELAMRRKTYVLNTLLKNKAITKKEYDEATKYDIIIYGKKEKINLTTIMYYQDAVFNELESIKNIPSSYLKTGGIKIYTNLDLKAQEALEDSINSTIKENDKLEANSIMIEPSTGKVIALIGGRNYNKSQYNRSLYSYRQIGSIMKPILYYSALENGFTASSCFLSEETIFNLSNDETYAPKNYSNLYGNKLISMAAAISFSDNIYAIKTHLFLGENNLVDTAYKMGIKTKLNNFPSLPLGTIELNILEITNAYSTIANEGIKNEPYFIQKIIDMEGNVLYEHQEKPITVLDKNLTFILSEMLSLTYDYSMIDYAYPTNISINALLTNKYAIKSGSTPTDNWIIGYNKNVVTSVWLGYDNNATMTSGDYKYSKQIWAKATEKYLKNKDNTWYKIPENVVGVIVDPISGTETEEKTNKKVLYYLKGTEPSYLEDVFETIE